MNTNTMKRLWIVVCWAVVAVCIQAVSIGHAAAANVCGAWVDGAGTVHIPEVNVDGAIYWATLQLEPGNDGAIILKLTDYGPAADNHCQNSQRTFYVASKGVPSAFIPSVEYAGAAYWWLLELVPSADGALRLKVTGRGEGGDWSGEGGALLATMKIEVVKAGDLQTTLKGRSPLGLEMDLTTTLLPNQPASPPSLTHSQPAEDTYEFQLTYTVPYSALPPALVARLRAASSLHATSDADEDNIAVVTSKAILKSQGKETLRQVVESAFGEEAAAVVRAGGKVLDVIKAWDIREKHQELMKSMDALEECAKKSDDPKGIQKTLDALAGYRNELKISTGMRFLYTMVSTAGGLIGAGVSASSTYMLDDIEKGTLNLAGLTVGGHWDRDYHDPNAKFIPSCIGKWSGTFEGTETLSVYAGIGCTEPTYNVTAEVEFERYSSDYSTHDAYFVYPLKSGSLHVTLSSPWLTCGPDTWSLFPSSFTVSLPVTALHLKIFYLSGHYLITFDPSGIEWPKITEIWCSGGDCGKPGDATLWFTDILEKVVFTLMMAEGEWEDPHFILHHNTFSLVGVGYVEGYWRLKEE